MSTKKILESTSKSLVYRHLNAVQYTLLKAPLVRVQMGDVNWDELLRENAWLNEGKLVVKVDQLIKRRGKLGLIKVNVDWAQAKEWMIGFENKLITVEKSTGRIYNFIVEPFVPHTQEEELYLSIYSTREGDEVLFHHKGGIDVGDVDAVGIKAHFDIDAPFSDDAIHNLLANIDDIQKKQYLSSFIKDLLRVYRLLNYAYLEINPLILTDSGIGILDIASTLDQTAEQEMKNLWGGSIDFMAPFGRDQTEEERFIAELDSKGGASLKLTVLNPHGRIWTMVAGGGASVVYSDTICSLGSKDELANYGEYSGAPSEAQTYEYAKTILTLATKHYHEQGKILLIGGGIANFTNVADTFKGIVRALYDFKDKLIEHNVSIYVRRGGPNYQEGLRLMQETGENIGIPMYVFGPDTHMTSIVPMSLGIKTKKSTTVNIRSSLFLSQGGSEKRPSGCAKIVETEGLFTSNTRAIIYGLQLKATQEMLDFDNCCRRKKPSVAALVYPFSGNHNLRFYWGTEEILIPVYNSLSEAIERHKDVDVLINFASLRSAYPSTMETLDYPQIKVIAIIAEGIPEQKTKTIIKKANEKGVVIIGPATVGGIKPGCFKIGNTGGKLDNIINSKLYRPGSVAYVSRSGGMSNELNNIISHTTNGVYEGIAIGGDRYPGSTFMDHILRYEKDVNVKMIVLLGEVGGIEEYKLCEAIKEGKVTKPVVAWCIGTCATLFDSDVQFGHAGALANSNLETAVAKNNALKEAGCHVPENFQDLKSTIKSVYNKLLSEGVIENIRESDPPQIPIDFSWAQELGLIRKPTSFLSSISDERGDELLYAGTPISKVFEEGLGIGGVVSLLWFKRKLPDYACKFIEMCLILTADHGPAVSGAHNTIVTARAGKDLVSSLTSGLLTIGDRFGGALDSAAKQFSEAFDEKLTPQQFVDKMRDEKQLIMGIGHRIKSVNSPDKRVQILKAYVKEHFPKFDLLEFAEQVEKITTTKKPNLILNVDGVIAVSFVDLLRHSGAFTVEEAKEYIEIGLLNGLFVLGRSIGFIGHYLDQRRLKQGLYRHPWDDISYLNSLRTDF